MQPGVVVGTKLFPIAEQKSFATLQTVPANWTFQSRIVSLQQSSSILAWNRQIEEKDHGVRRRRNCVSLDETATHNLHWCHNTSPATSSAIYSSTEESPQRRASGLPHPIRPPFAPPERVKTPDGLPSWRGEVAASPPNRLNTPTSSRSLLLRQLRSRSSRAFRHVFGAPDKQVHTQSWTWRPPISGHTTPRFGQLESHPFALARPTENDTSQIAREGIVISGQPQSQAWRGSILTASTFQQRQPLSRPGELQNDSSLKSVRNEQPTRSRVLSPSQRALQAASGNVVPVSPKRAQSHAEASNTWRSVSVPNGQLIPCQPPSANDGPSDSVLNGTQRTIELIEQFPLPPSGTEAKAKGKRPLVLSLFPRQNDNGSQPETRPAKAGSKSLQTRPVQTRAHDVSEYGNDSEANTVDPPDENDRPLIRGESISRYRHSGTPVYDSDAASLRSFDERRRYGVSTSAMRDWIESQ